jgi:hypothetical protein
MRGLLIYQGLYSSFSREAAPHFAGLRYLRDKLGERFAFGVVLYTGERTLPFGDRLAAVPLCGLWQS